MNQYTIYCTEQQTKKALELGAPIKINSHAPINGEEFMWISPPKDAIVWNNSTNCLIPTTEQMLGWLEESNIKCFIIPDIYEDDSYNIQINEELVTTGHSQYNYPLTYDTRKEATLAVIDAALEYLTKNKK